MNTIGLWQITPDGPERLPAAQVGLERDLEAWIEHDPAVLETGLVIVGRQIRLEGGPLDLLALDPQGRWVLIEVKRERLRREVVAQAIDYASCLHRLDPGSLRDQCDTYLTARGSTATLGDLLAERGRSLEPTPDEREIVIYLVGTSVDPDLERMVSFLEAAGNLAVRMVSFAPFRGSDGGFFLARTIHEHTVEPTVRHARSSPRSIAVEEVLALADANGTGAAVRAIHAAALDAGLAVRPYAKSIMIAPPANRSRCLFAVWVEGKAREPGTTKLFLVAEAFEQFFGLAVADTEAALGASGYRMIDAAGAEAFGQALGRLMRGITPG